MSNAGMDHADNPCQNAQIKECVPMDILCAQV
jgi:hypothetical protein